MTRFLFALWVMLASCLVLHAQDEVVRDVAASQADTTTVAPMAMAATTTLTAFDVNGDGSVNGADIIDIVKYVNGQARSVFKTSKADINGDGQIDLEDAKVLSIILIGGELPTANYNEPEEDTIGILRGDSITNPTGPTM